MIHELKEQYERFPYPPISSLALPKRGQGEKLRVEHAKRILVAGCGTLEALVVAQAHPRAHGIIAVDLSERSLAVLQNRIRLFKLARPLAKLPPIQMIQSDLMEWPDLAHEKFDYILASNVLHHVPDPASLLKRLASALTPEGILRIVTYPKTSRIWMRETSRFLRENGITPHTPSLVRRAREAILKLPRENVIRASFESQPETRTGAGIVDAFLNACENPLTPLEWGHACREAGLVLFAEGQEESSRSGFLTEIFPETHALHPWVKLTILDDLLELCANPILWLKKGEEAPLPPGFPRATSPTQNWTQNWKEEIKEALDRVKTLLRGETNLTLPEVYARLKKEVGPRVTAGTSEKILPGLSLTDYPLEMFLT